MSKIEQSSELVIRSVIYNGVGMPRVGPGKENPSLGWICLREWKPNNVTWVRKRRGLDLHQVSCHL